MLNISGLFKNIELGNGNVINCAETVVMRMKNGCSYEIVESRCQNGKMGNFLQVKGDEEDAIIEFFQNYMREGRLQKNTKKGIQTYLRKLKKKKANNQYKNDNIYIQESMSLYEGGEVDMYSNEFKYIYNSSRYEISDIIDFVIESRILSISPYILIKEKGYKSGTVSTWYKDNNELRILYSLYNMSIDDINRKFKKYDKKQIIEFNKQIHDLVLKCNDIDNDLKDKYIENINNFNLSLDIEDNNKEISIKSDMIKVITQNEEIWNAFANTNRDKIFEILYNDEEILSMLLEQIYI